MKWVLSKPTTRFLPIRYFQILMLRVSFVNQEYIWNVSNITFAIAETGKRVLDKNNRKLSLQTYTIYFTSEVRFISTRESTELRIFPKRKLLSGIQRTLISKLQLMFPSLCSERYTGRIFLFERTCWNFFNTVLL